MRVTIDLPDDLFENLVAHCPEAKPDKAAVNREIRGRLERLTEVNLKHDRWFIVGGDDRRKLEAIFQTSVVDSADLAKRTERLNQFGLGDLVRPMTDGEALMVQERAGIYGIEGAVYLRQILDKTFEDVLNAT